METAVTTSSPTPTIGVWLDNFPDGAFKDDVLSALQSLEGLPLEVHLSLAHNFLSTAPRSASAIAAYALAGWGPLGVAVRMAELYPEDEGVQAAAQTARMVADSTGKPVTPADLHEFRTQHQVTLARIQIERSRRYSKELNRSRQVVARRTIRGRSRRPGSHRSAKCGATASKTSSSDDGPGPSDPPATSAVPRLTSSTPRSARPAAPLLCLPVYPFTSTSRHCLVHPTVAVTGSPEIQMPAVTTSPVQSIPEDDKYIILARSQQCAVCRRDGATTVNLIVPASYGGTVGVGNLQPVHEKCGQLRHRIEGSSAEPPQGYTEDLVRLLAMPRVGDEVREILHFAATVKGTCRKPGSYNSLDACRTIKGLLSGSIGWGFLGWVQRPEGITPEDEEWLKTSSAYEAIFFSAYALLPADGR